MLNVKGVKFTKREGFHLCVIEELSDDLKDLIRSNLVLVCQGWHRSKNERSFHTYRRTLKELVGRLTAKSDEIKIGMIGELLSHLVISHSKDGLLPVSPYFNLEGRGVKLGFDILYSEKESNELWIVEVKSGEKNGVQTATEKNIGLIDIAKNDLKNHLNEKLIGRWQIALNGLDIAHRASDETKVIRRILESNLNVADLGDPKSSDHNAILVAVLFCGMNDAILREDSEKHFSKVLSQGLFRKVMVFSIHKGTYEKVIHFFEDELAHAATESA